MSDQQKFTDITCPLCGIACDDLGIQIDASGLRQLDRACATGEDFFTRAWPDDAQALTPTIDGESASLDDAIAVAATLLQQSKAPLVSGLAMDVNGIRAALALADRCGAVIDHSASEALFRNLRVVQDSGWFTTTFSEVRNRADLVILIGSDWLQQHPRFAERVLQPQGLFLNNRRKIVLIGPDAETLPADALGDADIERITMPLTSVAEAAGLLRLLYAGRGVSRATDLPVQALDNLAEHFKTAAYSVIVWSGAELAFPQAALTVESLLELIRQINQSTRAAGLPLGGRNGGLSAALAATWQTGFPLRTSFARGYPDHDVWLYDSQRMLQDNEADLLVWLSTLTPELPPDTAIPRIVIGHPGMHFEKPPQVYIPAGIPGVDQDGHCFRADGVVALPLRRLMNARWPSAKQIIERLLEATC